jgi:hypothetical protein
VPGKGYRSSLGTEFEGSSAGVRLGVSATDSKLWEFSGTNATGESLFSAKGGDTMGSKWLATSYGSNQNPAAKLFEDGILVGSAKEASQPSTDTGTDPLMLGGEKGTPSGLLVHEVLAYDRALTDDDVKQLTQYFAAELGQ